MRRNGALSPLALLWPALAIQAPIYFLLPFVWPAPAEELPASHLSWVIVALAVLLAVWGVFRLVAWVGSASRPTGAEATFGPIVPSEWRRRTGVAGVEWVLVLTLAVLSATLLAKPHLFAWTATTAAALLMANLLIRVEKRPVDPRREIPAIEPGEAIPAGEGAIGRTWTWTSHARGRTCQIALRLRRTAFEMRAAANPSGSRLGVAKDEDLVRDVVEKGAEDPEVIEVARQLLAFARSERFNYFEEAQNTLQFVQAIRYVTDQESKGGEYFRFALETLFEDQGDCDCKAILAASIFRLMGLRSLVLLSADERHAAVAVEGAPDFDTRFFLHGGKRFYFCETTDGSFSLTVGELPDAVWLKSYTAVEIAPRLLP